MNNSVDPKVGEFVFDFEECKKVKITAIKGRLYFVGKDRDPLFRNEFIYPLPSNQKNIK